MSSPESEVIVLRGGLTVRRSALDFVWALEQRGHEIKLSEDGGDLLVSSKGLDGKTCEVIRRYKPEIIRLVKYVTSSSVS